MPASMSVQQGLRVIGAAAVGLVAALAALMLPVTFFGGFHGPDPRSLEGVLRTLFAAGGSILIGAVAARITRSAWRVALGFLLGPLAVIGLLGVESREYLPFLLVSVEVPGCFLGALLGRPRVPRGADPQRPAR